ncbi:MAG: sigma-70 family RNA polymerase sigma factor [Xanthomonadales bacterium]|nr:sigma-70 family RNA polymerase sigma factor [Xanthomonadales bacterium]
MTDSTRQRYTCIESAWRAHRDELRGFLLKRGGDRDSVDDLLQTVYAKALSNRPRFCRLDSPRAWLFRVARNQWIDEQRRSGRLKTSEVPEMAAEPPVDEPLDDLIGCIHKTLPYCSRDDADIIRRCDLEGLRQADYAAREGLTLPAAKARLRRARQRLRACLIERCGISFDEQGRVCCHLGERG